MFYLLLAIVCSALIALIFKYTENAGTNRYVITSANYFIAFMVSLIMIFSKKLLIGLDTSQSFFKEVKLLNSGYVFSPYSSIIWGLLIGVLFGSFFFLSFIFYQKSVKENGVSTSGAIAKLGILIPMIFSIVLWKEIPSPLQWLGLSLALVSILIVNLSEKTFKRLHLNLGLLLLFIFGGLAEFSSKIYQKYALSEYKDFFLFTIFFTAFIISIFYTKKTKAKIAKKDIFIGFSVGIPNLFSSYFLILSLDTIKTAVAFPLYSAGSIILISIGGYLIFKERINTNAKVAIFLTIIALILINL
ncbi:MAG: hypothetical protein GX769_00565 [Erysipelothrix sp.]|nr:hypothetical protein [Erysipelothrix sp.]